MSDSLSVIGGTIAAASSGLHDFQILEELGCGTLRDSKASKDGF